MVLAHTHAGEVRRGDLTCVPGICEKQKIIIQSKTTNHRTAAGQKTLQIETSARATFNFTFMCGPLISGNDTGLQRLYQEFPQSLPAFIAPLNTTTAVLRSSSGSSSPVAPAYSPITPKVKPVLPHSNGQQEAFIPPPENGGNFTFAVPEMHSHEPDKSTAIAPTEYIAPPPNLPFSGEDATDAIALKAAISTLQIQKQKAHDDIKTLARIKQLALEDPDHFKRELAAGRLKEQRLQPGDLRAILDQAEEGDDEDEVVLGVAKEDPDAQDTASPSPEIPDSQPPSQATSFSTSLQSGSDSEKMNVDQTAFPRIPGPQNVVRMPHVNWEKYRIVGEPLDRLHEQQKRWPGSEPFQHHRGREHTVAAPYSPFLDDLQQQNSDAELETRKDFAATGSTTPSTSSDHPMETRRRNQA